MSERTQAAQRVLTQVAKMPASLLQGTVVVALATRLDLDQQDLRSELRRMQEAGPRRAVAAPAVAHGPSDGEPQIGNLQREALTLLLLNPALSLELADDDLSSVRDESARALALAWRDAVRAAGGRPELEPFVAGLDPATASLARSLLASARARGTRPDLDMDREALRVTLLRLRVEDAEGRLGDLQTLIRAAADDGASDDIRELERQFQELTREREQLVRAIRGPAVVAGGRRS